MESSITARTVHPRAWQDYGIIVNGTFPAFFRNQVPLALNCYEILRFSGIHDYGNIHGASCKERKSYSALRDPVRRLIVGLSGGDNIHVLIPNQGMEYEGRLKF